MREDDCSVHFAELEEFLGCESAVYSEAAFEYVLSLEGWGIEDDHCAEVGPENVVDDCSEGGSRRD